MPLQTSGAISLNDIHVEAGGVSNTTATINDSDIRGLINKGSGATMSFSEWYGASGATSYSLTTGSYAGTYGYSNRGNYVYGSLSPTSFSFGTILVIHVTSVKSNYTLWFKMHGNRSQSFFTTLRIGGVDYASSNANYSYSSNNNETTWTWSVSSYVLGTSGTRTVLIS